MITVDLVSGGWFRHNCYDSVQFRFPIGTKSRYSGEIYEEISDKLEKYVRYYYNSI